MIKLAVFSDTHGYLSNLKKAKELLPDDIDAVLHLGDFAADANAIGQALGVPVYAVCGNCDELWDSSDSPKKRIVSFDGVRILMTHGNHYRGTYELGLAAEEEHCGVVLFGHTHRQLMTCEGNVLVLNPGSLSFPRGTAAGFALLTIENGDVNAKIYEL